MATNHLPHSAAEFSSSPQNTINGTSSPQNTFHLEASLIKTPQNTRNNPQVNGIILPTKFPQPHTSPNSTQPQPTMHQDPITVTTLQDPHKPHSDSSQITDLLIKIAVLETSLQHAINSKEALEKSLGIVINSLTRFPSHTSPTTHTHTHPSYELRNGEEKREKERKGPEKEIECLRRENGYLREREKELGYRVAMRELLGEDVPEGESAGEEKGKGEERESVVEGVGERAANGGNGLTTEQLVGSWRESKNFRRAGNSGLTPEELAGSWGDENASFQHGGQGNVLTSKDLIGSWGNPSFAGEAGALDANNSSFHNEGNAGPTPEQLAGSWGNPFSAAGEAGPSNVNNSFGSGSTTVPNTPELNATSFESSFADVGLHTLEENMDMDDGFPPALSFPPSNTLAQDGEEEKDIDEQLLDQEAALQKFNATPKPGVLNVGFSLEGTKRGDDYDAHPLSPTKPPTFKREHSMKDYDRFGTQQPPSGPCAFNSPSPSLDLKTPSDLSGNQDLWTSSQERKDAVEIHMRSISSRSRDAELKFPEFFRYGIVYLPSSSDSNYLRTVMLSNLPLGTEVRDVLNRVRGGEVLSASPLDTSSITGSMSARIVFRHEETAEEYRLYCESHPLLFPSPPSSSESETQQATATLIQTPTFPLSPRHLSRLNHSQTRCLALPNFPPSISLTTLERHLASNNAFRGATLAEIWIDEDCTLHLQFSDVFWAGAAFGILTNFQLYRGLEVVFADDPCNGPLEELDLPLPPRPRMLPENWAELQKRAMGESADGVVDRVQDMQRKRLAALENQKVEIPSFSGSGLQGGSWADEVNELEGDEVVSPAETSSELEGQVAPPNSPTQLSNGGLEGGVEREGERGIDTLLNNFNGLSASIYAPSFFSPFSSTNETALSHTSHTKQQTQKSPPKINLSSLLASPTSSASTYSSPSPPRKSATSIREPRGPEHDLDLGFSVSRKIECYDREEEARDERNLGIPHRMLLEGLDKGFVEAVANPDEILLEIEDEV